MLKNVMWVCLLLALGFATLTKAETKILRPIYFHTAEMTLSPQSILILNGLAEIIQRNSDITLIEIQGHADARGSDDYNIKLSQGRAESVKNYLVQKGVDPSRLTAKGYGKSQPVGDNTTEKGMRLNRRVQFVVMERNK